MIALVAGSCALADATFEAYAQQFLGFDGELHWKLLEDLFTESVNDHVNGVLRSKTALVAIKNLIFTDFRSGRFMFH